MQAYERAIIHRDQVQRGDSRDSDDDDDSYGDADNEVEDIDERELEENGFV